MYKNHQTFNKKLKIAIIVIANGLFAVPNSLLIYRGFFTRRWADDYCFSGFYREYGFWQGLAYFYRNVSNRFSAYLFSAITDWIGTRAVQFVVPLTCIIFLTILFFSFRKAYLSFSDEKDWFTPLLLAQTVVFFLFIQAPNVNQSVYWRSGMSHYFLPLTFYLLISYIIFFEPFNRKKPWRIGLVFCFSFFAGGLSESYAALQASTALLLITVGFLVQSERAAPMQAYSITALVGTLLAMAVMVASPGNQMRLEMLQQAPDIVTIVTLSFRFAADFITYSIRGLWLPMLVSLLTAVAIGFGFVYQNSSTIGLARKTVMAFSLLATGFLLVASVCAPTVYGMMAFPEKRVLMLARLIMVLSTVLFGLLAGNAVRSTLGGGKVLQVLTFVMLIALSIYPMRALPELRNNLDQACLRAAAWDTRDGQIHEQISDGESEIFIPALDAFSEIAELSEDPSFWVNWCAAQYYGVESIVAIEGLNE